MKKISSVFAALFIVVAVLSNTHAAHAAASLPATSVWFTPPTATAGTLITLNALVYNNQTADATVTVTFTTPADTIGTVTALVPAQTAKTLSYDWKMPSSSAIVTATVTTAINKQKKSLPGLLGVLGTVSVAATPTPLINGISFPGSTAITAWLTPALTQVEAFRAKEAIQFSNQRDAVKKTLGTSVSEAFGNPYNYFILIYSSCLAAVFTSVSLFYIASILLALLLLRLIVNLIF
jgi:hypothetical protein